MKTEGPFPRCDGHRRLESHPAPGKVHESFRVWVAWRSGQWQLAEEDICQTASPGRTRLQRGRDKAAGGNMFI